MHRMCVEQCRGQSVWLSCMQVERDHGEEEGGRMRPASSPTQPITTTIPEEWGGLVQLTGSHEAQSSLIKLTVVIFLVKGTVRPKIERHIFYLLPAVSFIHLFFGDIGRRDVCQLTHIKELHGSARGAQKIHLENSIVTALYRNHDQVTSCLPYVWTVFFLTVSLHRGTCESIH